jgi:hypothetical protein
MDSNPPRCANDYYAAKLMWGVGMRKIAFLPLILFYFGPSFYSGFIGGGILAPLGWSAGMAIFAVGKGWREPGMSIFASVLFATCFTTAVNVPIYFIGRWLGNPASRSTAFTLAAFILGLLIFGLLTLLWRRIWPQQPASDKAARSDSTHESPKITAFFKKLHRLMDNEKAQIERLPEPLRSEVRSGADCDEIAGAFGEFGRDPRNPIPVNGPLGGIIYLSNLRTAASQQIMFHRLGSVGKVDIYETVSLDGTTWDLLFLQLYHPRKSRRPPSGYRIVSGAERNRLLLGTNEFLVGFPRHLSDAIANTSERLFGFRTCPPQVRESVRHAIFERPNDHLTRFNIIMAMLQRTASNVTPH